MYSAGKVKGLKVENGELTVNLNYLRGEETAEYIVSGLDMKLTIKLERRVKGNRFHYVSSCP